MAVAARLPGAGAEVGVAPLSIASILLCGEYSTARHGGQRPRHNGGQAWPRRLGRPWGRVAGASLSLARAATRCPSPGVTPSASWRSTRALVPGRVVERRYRRPRTSRASAPHSGPTTRPGLSAVSGKRSSEPTGLSRRSRRGPQETAPRPRERPMKHCRREVDLATAPRWRAGSAKSGRRSTDPNEPDKAASEAGGPHSSRGGIGDRGRAARRMRSTDANSSPSPAARLSPNAPISSGGPQSAGALAPHRSGLLPLYGQYLSAPPAYVLSTIVSESELDTARGAL